MSVVRRPRTQREQPDSAQLNDEQPLLATNTGVRLACTMAAMLSTFALFLCWAERESRVIRHFAVRSVALAAVHLLGGAMLGVISLAVGSVPYFGFLMTLMGWLIYIATAIAALYLRIRLMEHAWHGRRFTQPLLERLVSKYE